MAKRRSKNQNKNSNSNSKKDSNNDIVGIVLITLGMLMLFSIVSPLFTKADSVSGVIGSFLNSMLITIFGVAAYLVPFFVVFIGLFI